MPNGEDEVSKTYVLTVKRHLAGEAQFMLSHYPSAQHMNLTISQAQHLSDGIQSGIKFLQAQEKSLAFDLDTGQEM